MADEHRDREEDLGFDDTEEQEEEDDERGVGETDDDESFEDTEDLDEEEDEDLDLPQGINDEETR